MGRRVTDDGWVVSCDGCGYETDPDPRKLGDVLQELAKGGWYFNARNLCKKCVKAGKAKEKHRV